MSIRARQPAVQGSAAIVGTASITEAGDTLAATGAVAIAGAASITEAGDTLAATGTIAQPTETPSRGGIRYARHNWETDDKTERAREKAWQSAKQAQRDLRHSLEELISGRPQQAKEAVQAADEKLEQAIESLDEGAADTFLDIKAELDRQVKGALHAAQVRTLIERIEFELAFAAEEEAADEDAMIALLMAVA